jgi:hypothetical protein
MNVRRFAAAYFVIQGAGTVLWWMSLAAMPGWRPRFLAPGAPEATLFAFGLTDLVFFVAGSFAAAYGLSRRRSWALPILCVQAGAAGYASLYAVTLPVISGGGWMGAALMMPSLVIPLSLAWLLHRHSDN